MTKAMAQVTINKRTYSIRATEHAVQRMGERKVDAYVVAGTVLALGEKRLLELQAAQEEAIIIDKEKGVSVVVGFKKNTVRIITVLASANVFVKSGTEIYNI